MRSHQTPINRVRRLSGNVLIILPSLVLLGSAVAKLARVPVVAGQLAKLGFFGDRLTFIAILELVSAGLFLLPRTRSLGLLLVSSYLGGAIAAHVSHGESILQPSFVLVLFWIAIAVRHPESFWSFSRRSDAKVATLNDSRMAA